MSLILKIILFIPALFIKMLSYTLLTFIFLIGGLILLAYIYFGNEINIIIEKFHETIPQAIPI